MIEKAFKNENSFHLAGIVPVAGQILISHGTIVCSL